MKKMICIILTIAMIFTMVIPAYAISSHVDPLFRSETSFVDSEGKENSIVLEIPAVASSHVEYYIEGELIQIADAELSFSESGRGTFDTVIISLEDKRSGTISEIVEPISKYVQSNKLAIDAIQPRGVYVYQGKIEYNTIYDAAASYNHMLFIWYQQGNTTDVYRNINTAAGQLVSTLLSAVAAAITILCPKLAKFSQDLVLAIIYGAGVNVVGGIIQGAISKRYLVEVTSYNVKAEDVETSECRFFTGEKYRLHLGNDEYSSPYEYNGYMPWNTSTVAYDLFNHFWSTTYPGVKRYS